MGFWSRWKTRLSIEAKPAAVEKKTEEVMHADPIRGLYAHTKWLREQVNNHKNGENRTGEFPNVMQLTYGEFCDKPDEDRLSVELADRESLSGFRGGICKSFDHCSKGSGMTFDRLLEEMNAEQFAVVSMPVTDPAKRKLLSTVLDRQQTEFQSPVAMVYSYTPKGHYDDFCRNRAISREIWRRIVAKCADYPKFSRL